MDEWIKKLCDTHTDTHTMDYYSSIKKNKLAICDNMDGPWGHYVKWNESEKDKTCMISLIYGV